MILFFATHFQKKIVAKWYCGPVTEDNMRSGSVFMRNGNYKDDRYLGGISASNSLSKIVRRRLQHQAV